MGQPVSRGTVSGLGLTSQGMPPVDADARLRVDRREVHLESLEVRGALSLRGDAQGPLRPATVDGPRPGPPRGPRRLGRRAAPRLGTHGATRVRGLVDGHGGPAAGRGHHRGHRDHPPRAARAGARPRTAAAHRRCDGDPRDVVPRAERPDASWPRAASTRACDRSGSGPPRKAFAVEPWPAGAATERALPLRGRLSGSLDAGVAEGELRGRRPLRASRPLVGPAVPGGRHRRAGARPVGAPTASPPSCASTAPISRRSHELQTRTTPRSRARRAWRRDSAAR